ncbi:MAG: DEAD/DEAH box helicase [Micrococcaceae bacterium]
MTSDFEFAFRNGNDSLRYERELPVQEAVYAKWPEWLSPKIISAFQKRGISEPYQHQVTSADAIYSGNNIIIATGTASGKSFAYLLPTLQGVMEGKNVLYLAPTKALAQDQNRVLRELDVPELAAELYDGDTSTDLRKWIREHANYVLTNPDMLHHGILTNHVRWSRFFKKLDYIIIDEAHSYRGVFGSHVANVLRRLRRVLNSYGSDPKFIGASATASSPDYSFSKLIGLPVTAITEDTAAKSRRIIKLWEPPLLEGLQGENKAPVRRSATYETAELLANLVANGTRTMAFVRSRRAAETIALTTQRLVSEVDSDLIKRIAAYRSGYLPEERRELERKISSGEILGVVTTNALELGIDISGLDAVIISGWPGTRASFWQQSGRAGRSSSEGLTVFVAQDDPLDTYFVNHPKLLLDKDVEEIVFDPENPYVLRSHLCAAAAEEPLKFDEIELFGTTAPAVLIELVEFGIIRRRARGWYWVARHNPAEHINLRSAGGEPIKIVDEEEGTVLGTIDATSSHFLVHPEAVYLHQGRNYVVSLFDEDQSIALVRKEDTTFFTHARDITDIEITDEQEQQSQGFGIRHFGEVVVRNQVVSYQKKDTNTREFMGEYPLELPETELHTQAVWFTITPEAIDQAGIFKGSIPGALHAAEHAMIALLPVVAISDRWDIGGVSIAQHPNTGLPTIFVYDGHQGGAGFAERGYKAASTWLRATSQAIKSCECEAGCPSCVQSPKCGNRNEPLSKWGAIKLLELFI